MVSSGQASDAETQGVMIMKCDTYQEQMSLWIDNQLTQEEIRQLEGHTATCLACRASLDALRRVDRLFTSVSMISPAPGFTARFQTRLVAHRRRRRTWAGFLTLTLATLALVFVAAVFLTLSGLTLWGSLSANGMLAEVIGLLLDVGKAATASLKLAWVIVSALAQGVRHPAFLAYAIGTAFLVVVWTQIVTRRVLARRPVTVNLHS
jgi:anti-sigma factor RsiW